MSYLSLRQELSLRRQQGRQAHGDKQQAVSKARNTRDKKQRATVAYEIAKWT